MPDVDWPATLRALAAQHKSGEVAVTCAAAAIAFEALSASTDGVVHTAEEEENGCEDCLPFGRCPTCGFDADDEREKAARWFEEERERCGDWAAESAGTSAAGWHHRRARMHDLAAAALRQPSAPVDTVEMQNIRAWWASMTLEQRRFCLMRHNPESCPCGRGTDPGHVYAWCCPHPAWLVPLAPSASGGWISVEERLPKGAYSVFAVAEFEGREGIRHHVEAHYYAVDGRWSIPTWPHRGCTVTHWMPRPPLPAPPSLTSTGD